MATHTVAIPTRASEIHVDRRIELISIVMRLAEAEEYRMAPHTAYVDEVDKHFAPFAAHPAVARMRALREEHGIAFDAPMALAIHLDADLRVVALDELIATDERWQGVDVVAYAAELAGFAADTHLDDFIAAHAEHYRAVEAALHARIDAEHPIEWFDAMFGPRARSRYIIVPGMLEGRGNYGPHVQLPDGTVEMYQVLGLSDVDDAGVPRIGDGTVDLLIHEMAHSYVNPIFHRHHAALERAGRVLFPLVASWMQQQAYGSWQTMFDESGVRAATALYIRDHRGAAAAAAAIRREVARGFLWTAELEAILQRHHRDGSRFDASMPEVIALFDQLSTRYAQGLPAMPFEGPVNAVFMSDHVWLEPKTEALAKYVRNVYRDLHGDDDSAPLVAAGDTERDYAGRGLVAYGAPETSPIIASTLAAANIKLDRDRIAIGARVFQGPHLVLIACRPRSDDRMHGIAIYAAADERDLVDVNSIFHGGHDWLVARRTEHGFEILGSDDFPRASDGAWLLP